MGGIRSASSTDGCGPMAVALRPGSWELAGGTADGAPPTAACVLARQAALQERRRAAELNHSKQLYTKDPHGGPYRKVCAQPPAAGSVPLAGAARFRACMRAWPWYWCWYPPTAHASLLRIHLPPTCREHKARCPP